MNIVRLFDLSLSGVPSHSGTRPSIVSTGRWACLQIDMAADNAFSGARVVSIAALAAAATTSSSQRSSLHHPLTTTTTQAASDLLQVLRGVCGEFDWLDQLRGTSYPTVLGMVGLWLLQQLHCHCP